MQLSAGIRANPDGSVNAPSGATLDSSAYSGQGSAHLAVAAHLLVPGPAVNIEVRFDGTVLGTMSVDRTTASTWGAPLELADSRPRTIRLQVLGGSGSAPIVRVEKVVLRQP